MAEKSLSFWKDHHNNWLSSEISINRYCIENKLIPSTFKRWISKIEPQVKPVKINLAPEEKSTEYIYAEKANLKLKIPANLPLESLVAIFKALT